MKHIKLFEQFINEAASLVDEKTGKTVKLPYKTKDFRGDPITVVGFTEPHKSSSSGRIETSDGGSYFPGVAGLKIVGHQFESSVTESKKEITKYHKAAKKAGANKLSKIEPEYDDLYGHSFTFVDSDGDTVEIYYDKDQEGVAITQDDETDDISIDGMLKLIESSVNKDLQDDALALIKTDKKLQSAIKKATQSASERDWNQVWKRYDELGIDTNTEDFEGFDIEVVNAFDKL